MARWSFRLRILIFLSAILLHKKCEGVVYDGTVCYVEQSDVFYVAPHFDPDTLTPEMCMDGCANIGAEFVLAGITQGNVCLCGKSDAGLFEVPAGSPTDCTFSCPGVTSNPGKCGGITGAFSVYTAISNRPKIVSFTLSQAGTDITISDIDTGGALAYIYYEIGHGSLPVRFNDAVASSFGDIIFPVGSLPAGDLLVTVYATDGTGDIVISSSKIITTERPSMPLKVSCPIVAEPDISYKCGFSSISGSGSLPVSFIDSADVSIMDYVLDSYGADKFSLGKIPPRRFEQMNGGPVPLYPEYYPSAPVVISNSRAPAYLKLIFLEWFGAEVGSNPLNLYVYQPGCSLAAGGVYNPTNGLCEVAHSREIGLNRGFGTELTCEAVTFNNLFQDCYESTCSATNSRCLTSADQSFPDTYTLISGPYEVTGTPSDYNTYYYADLSTMEITLEPGQLLAFDAGLVGYMTESDPFKVDRMSDSGVSANGTYFIRAIGVKPEFLWFVSTCFDANSNYTATLSDFGGTVSVSNVTVCEDPIVNMTVTFVATETVQKPEWAPEICVKRSENVDILIATTKGFPITYNISYDDGNPFFIDEVITSKADARLITNTHNWASPGRYQVDIFLENRHSDPEFGSVGYIHNFTNFVNIQDPVLIDFAEDVLDFWLTTDVFDFKLILDDTKLPPTSPHFSCIWGDGLSNIDVSLNDSDTRFMEVAGGYFNYHLNHTYAKAGIYTVNCTLFNMVSSKSFSKEIIVYEPIVDFKVGVNFFQKGTLKLVPGLGTSKKIVPLGTPATFTFTYTTGTIDKIIVKNASAPSTPILGEFPVADIFNAKNLIINLTFLAEGKYNLTFQPWSSVSLDYPPVLVPVEIVGQVQGILVDDNRVISNKGDIKWFNIKFDSVGAGTCVVIDYKDGYKVAYGAQEFCKSWSRSSKLEYIPGYETIPNPFVIDHVYYDYGMFNVTAYAHNFVTDVETFDDLMVIVTSAPCNPPEVTIPFNSTIGTAPKSYSMSQSVAVGTLAKLNCSGVISTRKTWEIYKAIVNETNLAEKLTIVKIASVAPATMDKAELIIPARALSYGVYKLIFFSRMWDTSLEDPMWTRKLPFERNAFTYIEIVPSELTVKLIDSTADLVTRGKGQTLVLEPYLYSFDPDYPHLKDVGLEFRWFCRMMTDQSTGETFPTDTKGQLLYDSMNLITIPDGKPVNTKGGCFGSGPGAINATEGSLTLDTKVFHDSKDKIYEIVLQVRKDTSSYKPGFWRTSSKKLQVNIVPGIPPLMKILCADPALCFTNSTGDTFINPSSRLALKASCSLDEGSDCTDPMTYKWVIRSADGLDLTAEFLSNSPTGISNIEVAVFPNFFNETKSPRYFVGLTAFNALESKGSTMMFININQVPFGGTCEVNPLNGVSMVDDFFLICNGWTDKELGDAGIKHYLVTSVTNDVMSTLAKVNKKFDGPLEISLSTGVHYVTVVIEDLWGAKTLYKLPNPVVVDPVSADDFKDFMSSGKLDELLGTGDTGAMLMALQAQAQVLADSDETLVEEKTTVNVANVPLTPAEEEFNKAAAKGTLKVNSLVMLNISGAAVTTDLSSAQIVAKTVEALVGEPPLPGEKGTVGLEATKAATDILQQLVNSIAKMEGIAEPSAILPTMTSMTNAIGTLLEGIMGTSSISPDENSSADELCSQLLPIDTISADKPGVVDYDTDIGDDIEAKVPEDPLAQRCGGIIDAAKLTGEKVGPQLLDMLASMGQTLLSKSVVNEVQLIETPTINIYAKMTLGKEMGKTHKLGNSADAPWVKFPDDFCLGPLKNSTCDTPAGVSAVVYDSNPMGSLPSSPRLSSNTKVIEVTVSNRDNVVIDIRQIYHEQKEGIQFFIPRANKSREGMEPPQFYNTSAVFGPSYNKTQYMMHMIEVGEVHVDSVIIIEFYPMQLDTHYVLLFDYERIPTYTEFEHVAYVSIPELKSSNNTKIRWDSNNDFYEWFLDNDAVANRTGRFFITVATIKDGEIITSSDMENKKFDKAKMEKFSGDYSLRTFHAGCYYFNRKQYAWVADGVKVEHNEYSDTICRASHLTSFASGFFPTPNTIDFDFVFADASLTDNMTIYFTLIVCLLVYVLLSICARFLDVQDNKRLVSLALPDNNPQHNYLYEILTFTGHWDGSSCDSAVYFELTGDYGSSGERNLDPGRRDTLRKGTVDSYVMKSPRPLGSLNYIRIWHDHSGRDDYASWFLSAVIVIDLQTGERYEFALNRWLAAEKEDGAIERLIQASGQRSCQDMMMHTAARHIKENHLWFSIFFRSHRSRYTRLQRTATAFTMLFLGMLANLMWYGVVPEESTNFQILNLAFSPTQLYVGCMVTLITIFPTLLIVLLFKKSSRFRLRPNRIDTALERSNQPIKKKKDLTIATSEDSGLETNDKENGSSSDSSTGSSSDSSSSSDSDESGSEEENKAEADKAGSGSGSSSGSDSESSSDSSSAESEGEQNGSKSAKSRASTKSAKSRVSSKSAESARSSKSAKSKKSPTASATSKKSNKSAVSRVKSSKEETQLDKNPDAAVIPMDNADSKYEPKKRTRNFTLPFFCRYIAWLICLLTIVASCFFILLYGLQFGNDKTYQWLASSIIAFFFSMLFVEPIKVALIACCVSATCRNVDLDKDDDVEDDEVDPEIADSVDWITGDLEPKAPSEPIDEVKLDMIRIRRQKDVEMWSIVNELAGFFVFIVVVFIMAYLSRDISSFRYQNQLADNFVFKNGFDKVATANDWWKWIHATAVTELKAAAWYNGQPPYGLRGFIGDLQSRVMGYGTLRQIRVRPNSCHVHKFVLNLTQECAQQTIFINEDDTDYCNAWEEKNPLTEFLPSCSKAEFKHTTAEELNSMPYSAQMDSYGGGGYVYHIKGSSATIRTGLRELQQQRWINNHTRAVFLEFSVYNANLNLFGIASIVAEFIPGGGIKPYWRFDPVRLLHYHSKTGTYILICEIIFCFYILFFTYKFIRDLKSMGWSYFDSYWSFADVTIIAASFAGFGIYAWRLILTNEILDTFVKTKGNGYMKLQHVGLIDENYGYLVALILFVANIKLIKLLRFNNRFSQLILTLRSCWDDLSGFLAIFFLLFFAFVQLFFMILQPNLDDFKSITAALETCFTMMLNKFKFGTMKETSMTAAVMFFIFAVSCSFILINVLLTIIIEAYEKVKNELAQRGNEYEILDFLKVHAKHVIGLKELPPKENALADDYSGLRKEQRQRLLDEAAEEEDGIDINAKLLPEKVDRFLEVVNDTYFDGELTWRDKFDRQRMKAWKDPYKYQRKQFSALFGDDSDSSESEESDDEEENGAPKEPTPRKIFNSSDDVGRGSNFTKHGYY